MSFDSQKNRSKPEKYDSNEKFQLFSFDFRVGGIANACQNILNRMQHAKKTEKALNCNFPVLYILSTLQNSWNEK